MITYLIWVQILIEWRGGDGNVYIISDYIKPPPPSPPPTHTRLIFEPIFNVDNLTV